MIVPDVAFANNPVYRDIYGSQRLGSGWEPGTVHKGFNYPEENIGLNNIDYIIEFTTAESINLNSLNTYFIVTVYNYNDLGEELEITEARSNVITQNDNNVPMSGGNEFIGIMIENFTEHEMEVYSAKPTFYINIGKLLGITGGRFSVKIEHINDTVRSVYTLKDVIFNVRPQTSS